MNKYIYILLITFLSLYCFLLSSCTYKEYGVKCDTVAAKKVIK